MFVSPAIEIQELSNKINKSIEHQSRMKEFTVNIDVAPLNADKNFGDQFYLEQITFIC